MHEVNMQCSIIYCDRDYELLSGVCEDLFIGALLVLSLSLCVAGDGPGPLSSGKVSMPTSKPSQRGSLWQNPT